MNVVVSERGALDSVVADTISRLAGTDVARAEVLRALATRTSALLERCELLRRQDGELRDTLAVDTALLDRCRDKATALLTTLGVELRPNGEARTELERFLEGRGVEAESLRSTMKVVAFRIAGRNTQLAGLKAELDQALRDHAEAHAKLFDALRAAQEMVGMTLTSRPSGT